MRSYKLNHIDAYKLSKGLVSDIVEMVDAVGFKRSCNYVKRGEFPLRYPKARFLPRKEDATENGAFWNDPLAPFGYESVAHNDRDIDKRYGHTYGYTDVFGHQDQGAVINNIIIDRINPFGLDEGDNLDELVREITLKQEAQFRDELERHREELARIRFQYGAHDPRYKTALLCKPKMGPTVIDVARHEMELLFLNLTFDAQPFGLIGLDLGRHSMNLGVELGMDGKNKGTRYFGILELGRNGRWRNNPCLMYSTYAKEGGTRYLHPFFVHSDALRKDSGNDIVRFLASAIMHANKAQEFFGRFSTDVHRFYTKIFPRSAVPGSRARP